MGNLKIDYQDLHGLMEEEGRKAEERRGRRGRFRRALLRLARWCAVAVVLAVLPFFVLVRGGVAAYHAWGLGPWPSLGVGALASALLLALYAWIGGRKLGAGPRARRLLRRGVWGVGLAWVIYALVYVAGANVKSDEVRAEYRSLHPLLRVAASAVFVLDGETVMTDAGRSPEDYRLMGLPVNEASLHYPQDDGFVHALDLRTRGRREWRNQGLAMAFWALGFHTLRHRGTADHLHLSLRLPR